MTVTLAALIPTRNRASLAINAVRSLLDQDCGVEIYVSDNSPAEDGLREFCVREPRVTYLRPARELSMPAHWDWAVQQMLERSTATHFTVHYDRKVSKPRRWGALAALASRLPDSLFTFPSDFVSAIPPPRRLWQTPWTGRPYRVESGHVTQVMAAGGVWSVAHAIPVLSNCLVPRAVLEAIRERFGSICDSTGPDSCFMWRFLALHGSYIHYDRAMGVLYAAHRSNGMGFLRGKGGDFADYLKTFGEGPWLDAAPVPGLNLGHNMLYHEHAMVRRQTGGLLPPLDRDAVLTDLGRDLRWVEQPAIKAELRRVLRAHGWNGVEESLPGRRPAWNGMLREWVYRALTWMRGRTPPAITGFSYVNDEQAIRADLKHPRPPQADTGHLAPLNPAELGIG